MKATSKKSALTLVAEQLIAEKTEFNIELQCNILAREIVGYDAKNKEVQEIKKQLDNARDERGARKNEINKLLKEFRTHGITLGKDARTCPVKKALKSALISAGLTDSYSSSVVDAVKYAIDNGTDYDIHAKEKAAKRAKEEKIKELEALELARQKKEEKERKQKEKEEKEKANGNGETPPATPPANNAPPATNNAPPATNNAPPATGNATLTVGQLKSNFLKIVPNMIASAKATRKQCKDELNNSVLDELVNALELVAETIDNLGSK